MPLQNRVTPWNDIVAVDARGMFMGTRGCLHDDHRRLKTQRWTRKCWITCRLDFKDRHRELMTPSRYTELFFLDEATSFAAGHRPCAECRRADYVRFNALWVQQNPHLLATTPATARNVDGILHHERVTRDGTWRRWAAPAASLPDGTMVLLGGCTRAYLCHGGRLLRWSPDGYLAGSVIPAGLEVSVLTPRSVTRALAAVYQTVLHDSAAG